MNKHLKTKKCYDNCKISFCKICWDMEIAVCDKCKEPIEELNVKNITDEQIGDFYESGYYCDCGERIDWSNQVDNIYYE